MQDQTLYPPAAPRRRSARLSIALVLLAFLGGGALVGWLALDGRLAAWLPQSALPAAQSSAPASLPRASGQVSPPPPVLLARPQGDTLGSVETRLALLEERLSRLDLQARAASGNAARAEGLLIAFAARRTIERGAPLGYLEDQLRLRFGDAQPNAVRVLIDAARQPITLDQLSARLSAAAPALERARREESAWTSLRRQVSELLVVRRGPPAATAQDRMARARLLLQSGNVQAAIAEVERMPGATGATEWVAAAQRYAAAQRALDQIEAAAMLEPRRLQDAEGRKVEQPSPLAAPAALPGPPAPQAAPLPAVTGPAATGPAAIPAI